jgi:hypothetical protein
LLASQASPNLHAGEQADRKHKRQEVIQKPEHQQRRDHGFLAFAAKTDQYRGVEYA